MGLDVCLGSGMQANAVPDGFFLVGIHGISPRVAPFCEQMPSKRG
jgi:hypothetical protein